MTPWHSKASCSLAASSFYFALKSLMRYSQYITGSWTPNHLQCQVVNGLPKIRIRTCLEHLRSPQDPWKYPWNPDPNPDRNSRNFLKTHSTVRIEIGPFWLEPGGGFPDRKWTGWPNPEPLPDKNWCRWGSELEICRTWRSLTETLTITPTRHVFKKCQILYSTPRDT